MTLQPAWARRYGTWIAILLVMLGAWSVRWIGLRHGEPVWIYHPDVAKQTLMARHVYHGEENAHAAWGEDRYAESLYPYGTAVWLGRLYRWRDARADASVADSMHRYYWALRLRALGAATFVLCLGLTLLLLRRHLSWPGLLALGALVAFEPVTSQHSHYAMGDAPMVGLMLLAWALAWRMLTEPCFLPWASLLAGLAVGSAFAVKYQGVLALLFPGLAWLLLLRQGHRIGRATLSASAVAIGVGAGVVLSCPLLILDPSHFVENFGPFMTWQANITEQNYSVLEKCSRNWLGGATVLLKEGGWLLLPLTAWSVVAFRRRGQPCERRFAAVAAWVLAGVLALVILVSRDVVRSNDVMPIRCFLAAAAVPFLWWPTSARAWRRWLDVRTYGLALAALTAVVWLGFSLQDSLALARTDTRERAHAWCLANIPAGSIVLRELYVLASGRDDIVEHTCRAIGEPPIPDYLKTQRCDYIITCSLAHERFSTRWLPHYDPETAAVYAWIEQHFDEVATFTDHPMDFSQPDVRVFRAKPVPAAPGGALSEAVD